MQLAIKILLLFVDGLFNGFLVEKYTACEIHRNPISDGIVFKT